MKQTLDTLASTKDSPGSSGEQRFSLTWRKDLRPSKRQKVWIHIIITIIIIIIITFINITLTMDCKVCWDVSSSGTQAPVLLYNCHGQGGNQAWRYRQHIHHYLQHHLCDESKHFLWDLLNQSRCENDGDCFVYFRYDVDNQWLVHGGNPR